MGQTSRGVRPRVFYLFYKDQLGFPCGKSILGGFELGVGQMGSEISEKRWKSRPHITTTTTTKHHSLTKQLSKSQAMPQAPLPQSAEQALGGLSQKG